MQPVCPQGLALRQKLWGENVGFILAKRVPDLVPECSREKEKEFFFFNLEAEWGHLVGDENKNIEVS